MSENSYTYLIRCEDDSLYCGYTTDITRRVEEHKKGIGSRYVRAKKFMKLELYFVLGNKKDAMRLEREIKKLTKTEKESMITSKTIPTKLQNKIEITIIDTLLSIE